MKYIITILASVLIFSSCKKNDVPKEVFIDTTNNPATVLKYAIEHQDKEKIKHHQGAMEALVNLPEGGPIPPHLLPAKDLTFVEATDTTALYTFISGPNKINATTGTAGTKVKVGLKRVVSGTDTTWIMARFEEIH